MVQKKQVLAVPAIETDQSPGRKLYSFSLDGKLLLQIAAVSRLKRQGEKLHGYQRPEVLSHISEIRAYLESPSPMIPNSIVLAFDPTVTFQPSGHSSSEYARPGTLIIPIDPDIEDEKKPAFIVDGQQRLAAIRDARLERFPVTVTSFITDDIEEQTEQFMLVNSTKPLPKSLIYELLPSTRTRLPSLLERRKLPAYLTERLNLDDSSPMCGKIKSATNPDGIIKDNSVLRMIENSLTDGLLYLYRDPNDEKQNANEMLAVLSAFWTATSEVFSDSWGLSPKRSRLMHGAGIVSMGFVMDAIGDRRRDSGSLGPTHFREDLEPLRDVCRWTHGYWDFGPGVQRKWNEVQNTSRDIQLLANYLLVQYKKRVWTQPN
jgi:DGQHR domain-containing protein